MIKVSYDEYLIVNQFKDNIESELKHLRRYFPSKFNEGLEIISNQHIIKQSDKKDVQRPKYNYEKKG